MPRRQDLVTGYCTRKPFNFTRLYQLSINKERDFSDTINGKGKPGKDTDEKGDFGAGENAVDEEVAVGDYGLELAGAEDGNSQGIDRKEVAEKH
ncbi:MAG: hypothetical protein ASARMPRED_004345 [Alectoria sarmentosa]|nr:MAG: hypothetical protein ASARMPRED_004345 [Alectoria sarmentosa]